MGFYNQQIYHEREVMRIMEKFGEPVKAHEIAHFCRFMPANALRATLLRLVEGKFLVKETYSGKYYTLYPSRYYERKRRAFMYELSPIINTYRKNWELIIYGEEALLEKIERELLEKHQVKNSKLFRERERETDGARSQAERASGPSSGFTDVKTEYHKSIPRRKA